MDHRLEITGDTIEFVKHILDCYLMQERLNGSSYYVVNAVVSVEDDEKQYLIYETR